MALQHVDTDAMSSARAAYDNALSAYRGRKDDFKHIIEELLDHWEGDGKKAFEKDYKLLYRQLEDLQDVLMDLRKGLIDAQETFIQTDAEVSKSIGSALGIF